MDNYLLAYYQAIENGSIVVGKWIKLFYRYLIEGLQKQSFFFDQRLTRRSVTLKHFAITVRGVLTPSSWNCGKKLLSLWCSASWTASATGSFVRSS